MVEAHYAGVYWGARQETAAQCAQRTCRLFEGMAQLDASWGQWYRASQGQRRSPGLPVPLQAEEIEALLAQGRLRGDVDKSRIFEESGFRLRVWNQRPDSGSTRVNIVCGDYSWRPSNVCLAQLPSQGEALERLVQAPLLARLLEYMAVAWEPDWGSVNSNLHVQLTQDEKQLEVPVGWLTYFSRRLGTLPPLPAPVRIEPVGTMGMLVILTPERFTATNPEHLELATRVRQLLDRAGLLAAAQAAR